ncbi:MAG: EamA family transporter [Oscillatoriophycideae cyanobacterium NC_groundwater_1537_Pr4_S-0.65um_50_18]|nr:EamA family transporter [Oscillatoriophycideae cyanobacterium NC_groundwater_1537_Pr4_S-0.65um_50_18]
MTLAEFCLLFLSLLASVGGQFLLKAGALKLGKVSSSNVASHILGMVTTPEVVAGIALYGLGAIAYILLLTRVNLSVASPSIALSYVFAVLIGFFIFKEAIPIQRVVGLGFIVCGVLLVLWKK